MISAPTYWLPIRDGDPRGLGHYLAHYSSRKARRSRPWLNLWPNRRRWIGNGEHMALLTVDGLAHFAWRKQEIRDDDQTGVECCIFRNTGPILSSDLIREADALAFERWPGERHFTFVDEAETRARRGKGHEAGYCFEMAGWTRLEERTQRGLVVLELHCDALIQAGREGEYVEVEVKE